MTYGTSYFVSHAAAVRYYRATEGKDARSAVERKLAEGQIHIGKPELKPGEALTVVDNGTRYAIKEAERSLYDALKAAGIPTSNHESDLYFPVTAESIAILERYPTEKGSATTFTNQVEGGRWYDVPFAFTPWWESRTKGGR